MSRLFDDASHALNDLHTLIARYENENYQLAELVSDVYTRFHGVVMENWSYSTKDFDEIEKRMRELRIGVPRHE